MTPRGYRYVRSHPCKCGREGCLAWGARKYSDDCWKNMPSRAKERILERAMGPAPFIPHLSENSTRTEDCKRLRYIPYEDLPPVSGGLV